MKTIVIFENDKNFVEILAWLNRFEPFYTNLDDSLNTMVKVDYDLLKRIINDDIVYIEYYHDDDPITCVELGVDTEKYNLYQLTSFVSNKIG